jgi:hypothetical protein
MQSSDPTMPVQKKHVEHPEFTTEHLALDVETATDLLCAAVNGVTATETTVGTKLRTQTGMLVAILTEADDGVDLHYRTAPASEPATLKARRLWRALRPYAE